MKCPSDCGVDGAKPIVSLIRYLSALGTHPVRGKGSKPTRVTWIYAPSFSPSRGQRAQQ